MNYYDMCVRELDMSMVIKAKDLGFKGLFFVSHDPEVIKDDVMRGSLKGMGFDVLYGIEIRERNPGKIKHMAESLAKKHEVVSVLGGDMNINRAAAECRFVDFISNFWDQNSPGINHVIVREAVKNNVAFNFTMNPVIYSYSRTRGEILSKMIAAARVIRKYKAPFMITSGAMEEWDLRSPSDLRSFGKILGFQDGDSKKAISDWLEKIARKRKSKGYVIDGIEFE